MIVYILRLKQPRLQLVVGGHSELLARGGSLNNRLLEIWTCKGGLFLSWPGWLKASVVINIVLIKRLLEIWICKGGLFLSWPGWLKANVVINIIAIKRLLEIWFVKKDSF